MATHTVTRTKKCILPLSLLAIAALVALCGCTETIREPYYYTVGWFRNVKIDDGSGTLVPQPDSQLVLRTDSTLWFQRGGLGWDIALNVLPVDSVDTVRDVDTTRRYEYDTLGLVRAYCFNTAKNALVMETDLSAVWAVFRGLTFDSTLSVHFANSTEAIVSRGAFSFELHSRCGRAVGEYYWVTVGGYTEKKSLRSLFGGGMMIP